MRKLISCASSLALVLTLSACGTDQPANNVVAEDLNAMPNLDEVAPGGNATEESAETPTTENPPVDEAKPAPATPAPAKREHAEPKPAEPKPAEPKAPAAECAPEHRAAGHC